MYDIYLIPLALTDSNDRVGEDRDWQEHCVCQESQSWNTTKCKVFEFKILNQAFIVTLYSKAPFFNIS